MAKCKMSNTVELRLLHICAVLMLVMSGVNAKCVRRMTREPSRRMELYFHDIIYNGHNKANATSAMVAAPDGGNLTTLGGESHFGDMAVFDDPITLGPQLNSTRVGRAQGLYFYDQKNRFSAWLGFTFVLDSPKYRGTISFAGADPLLNPKRDISVIGGTGDFALARGIATVSTSAFEGDVYFRLLLNISLYD